MVATTRRRGPMSGESPATAISSTGADTEALVRQATAKPDAASSAGDAAIRSGKPVGA